MTSGDDLDAILEKLGSAPATTEPWEKLQQILNGGTPASQQPVRIPVNTFRQSCSDKQDISKAAPSASHQSWSSLQHTLLARPAASTEARDWNTRGDEKELLLESRLRSPAEHAQLRSESRFPQQAGNAASCAQEDSGLGMPLKSRSWWPRAEVAGCLLTHPTKVLTGYQTSAEYAGEKGREANKVLAMSNPATSASPSARFALVHAPKTRNSAPHPSASTSLAASLGRDESLLTHPPQTPSQSTPGSAASFGSPEKPNPKLKVLFSMVMLDTSSREALLKRVPPQFERVSAEHMTLHFKPNEAAVEALPIGQEMKLRAFGIATSGSCQAVAVEAVDFEAVALQIPHITISVHQNSSFKAAGPLVQSCLGRPSSTGATFTAIVPPLELRGVVCARLTNGSTVFSRASLPTDLAPQLRPRPASGGPKRPRGANDMEANKRLANGGTPPRAAASAAAGNSGADRRRPDFGEERPLKEGAAAPGGLLPTSSDINPLLATTEAAIETTRQADADLDAMLLRIGISRDWVSVKQLPEDPSSPSRPSQEGAASSDRAAELTAGNRLLSPGTLSMEMTRSNEIKTSEEEASDPTASENILQIEALLQAWSVAAGEPQVSKKPLNRETSSAQPDPKAAIESSQIIDEQMTISATGKESQGLRGDDVEDQFWAQLLASSRDTTKEQQPPHEAVVLDEKQRGLKQRHKRLPEGPKNKKSDQNQHRTAKKSRDRISQQQLLPPPSRPGRESLGRLWKQADGVPASKEAQIKPKLPRKLLTRGRGAGAAAQDSASAAAEGEEANSSSFSYAAWLEELNEESEEEVQKILEGTVLERSSDSSSSRGGENDLSESDSQIESGGFWAEAQDPRGTEETNPTQMRGPVSFRISRPSRRAAKAGSKTTTKEQEEDAGAEDVEAELAELRISSGEEDDDDISGGPWWAARRLPETSTSASSAAASGRPDLQTPNTLGTFLQAWNGAAEESSKNDEEGGTSSTGKQPQRRVFNLPTAAFKSRLPPSTPPRVLRPAPASEQLPQMAEADWDEMLADMESEVLAQGVAAIKTEFPNINQSVAEMTLKSHHGDVEDAVSFLQMTSLTATPAQLGQLGLQKLDQQWKPHSGEGVPPASHMQNQVLPAALQAPDIQGSAKVAELLTSTGHEEVSVAVAVNGLEAAMSERRRLQAESDAAREQCNRHYRAKTLLTAAADRAEQLGQKEEVRELREMAQLQADLAAECRKICNAKAFECSNRGVTNRIKLDLHRMNVDEAIEKLTNHIFSLRGLSSATFILQVVTGVGKHSFGGKAKLLPAVLDYVTVNDLVWEEEPGNPGQINVILAAEKSG